MNECIYREIERKREMMMMMEKKKKKGQRREAREEWESFVFSFALLSRVQALVSIFCFAFAFSVFSVVLL